MNAQALPLPTAARRSGAVLLVANLVPLVGVAALGWDLVETVLVYWAESIVIGGFAVIRILSAAGGGDLSSRVSRSVFFCVHFGIFQIVQIVLLFAFLRLDPGPVIGSPSLHATVAALAVSHGYSLWTHWIRGGERLRADAGTEMARPYARVFVQQFVVILGAGLLMATGDARWLLILLVVLKTAVDLFAHTVSHRG